MADRALALTSDEIANLEALLTQPGPDARRAQAVLTIHAGGSRADAATASGLSAGQVDYFLRRFREQRLGAFETEVATPNGEAAPTAATPVESLPVEAATVTEPAPPAAAAAAAADSVARSATPGPDATELRHLVQELNSLVADLQKLVPESKPGGEGNPYSPIGLVTLLRDNVQKLTPDVQLGMLQSFQGMTAEDLLDIETWKGMAYMMSYSAKFQAGQMRDKVSGTINDVVPEPIQPGRLWALGKSGLDKVTPEFAKQILSTFEGASPRDLLDPNTWKGLWYMINYSLQFQAEQLKQRLTGTAESSS